MGNEIDGLIEQFGADAEVEPELIRQIARGEGNVETPAALEEEGKEEENKPLYAAIKDMKMAQKIKLAIFGNMTARGILIRDPNKLVSLFVLQNSRVTENEVVDWARNKDLDEQVLRAISQNSTWMRLYSVKLNIVSNPRVPGSISIKWLPHILEKDLRKLSKSRDIPQIVANQAARLLSRKG